MSEDQTTKADHFRDIAKMVCAAMAAPNAETTVSGNPVTCSGSCKKPR